MFYENPILHDAASCTMAHGHALSLLVVTRETSVSVSICDLHTPCPLVPPRLSECRLLGKLVLRHWSAAEATQARKRLAQRARQLLLKLRVQVEMKLRAFRAELTGASNTNGASAALESTGMKMRELKRPSEKPSSHFCPSFGESLSALWLTMSVSLRGAFISTRGVP